jgi:hypothetical protein
LARTGTLKACRLRVLCPVLQPAFFKGDAPELLDMLVEASTKKPTAPLPGWGRELVSCAAEWLSEETAVTLATPQRTMANKR